MGGPPLKILLLEDDPLMQRFVSMAINGTCSELTCCENVTQALRELETRQFDFILTDLMLPGESGLSFIRKLFADPILANGAELIALSAGIEPTVGRELESLGVRKQLLKPVSVSALHSLFNRDSSTKPTMQHSSPQEAVQRYFGGQQELYRQFKEQSRTQFTLDMLKGDALLDAQDLAALHQLAHSLKSVLLIQGQDRAHSFASELEALLLTQATKNTLAWHWGLLRAELEKIARDKTD